MTGAILEVCRTEHLEGLVCLGGGGTAKNALRLGQAGLNVLTLPKTIDNDVVGTDATFGFATALEIATDAIDRLHSTAHSHHRIIVAEIMGHRAGWLTLGAGLAGGADVILIPEIPYKVSSIAAAIRDRVRKGSNFSIVAVAEGARNVDDARALAAAEARAARAKDPVGQGDGRGRGPAARGPAPGQHPATGAAAGAADRARVPRLDPRLRPARRHALADRPPAGHAPRHRGGRPRRRRHVRGHGRGPGRRDRAGPARGRRRPAQARAGRSLLGRERPQRRAHVSATDRRTGSARRTHNSCTSPREADAVKHDGPLPGPHRIGDHQPCARSSASSSSASSPSRPASLGFQAGVASSRRRRHRRRARDRLPRRRLPLRGLPVLPALRRADPVRLRRAAATLGRPWRDGRQPMGRGPWPAATAPWATATPPRVGRRGASPPARGGGGPRRAASRVDDGAARPRPATTDGTPPAA